MKKPAEVDSKEICRRSSFVMLLESSKVGDKDQRYNFCLPRDLVYSRGDDPR